jgi:hypothetical protein
MKNMIQAIASDVKFIRDHELQPRWYKVLKIFLLLGVMVAFYLIYGGRKSLVFFGCFFGLGFLIHLIYRAKTKVYTQSWLDFEVEEVEGKLKYQRIGIYYYLAVLTSLILSFFASQILVK